MRQFVRAMVIPFFMALFPAVWYINRNLTTARLPPHTEPTTTLVVAAIGIAVFGSLVFAVIVAQFRRRDSKTPSQPVPYPQRIFQPDTTALVIFGCFVATAFVWALIEMVGFGPAWLGRFLEFLLIPVALPLLVLAPFAIRFHWAVVLGLVLCVLWMSLLGTLFSDVVHQRSGPVMNT